MSTISILAMLITFIFQTVGTHIMSTNDYGIFSKWLTDLSYLSIFFILGLDSSLLYHARLGEKIESNNIKNLVIYTIIYLLSLIIIVLIKIKFLYGFTLVSTIYLFSITGVIQAYFQFNENFKVYNLLTVIRPFLILIVFSFIYFNNKIVTYKVILFLYASAVFLFSIISIVIYLSFAKIQKPRKFLDVKYYTYGLKSIINKILSLLLYSSCIYIISYITNNEMVAYFFVASSISKMIWVIPDSAGNLLYPKFLKIHSEDENKKAINLMFFYAQILFVINIGCALGFFIFGEFFLNILYKKSYIAVYIPTIILLVGNQGMVYYKLISRYLASMNNWKPLYLGLLISIVLNVALNFLLIPIGGIIGSAIATSIAFWSCGIVVSFYVKGSFFAFINPMPVLQFVLNFLLNKFKYINQ